MKKGQLFSGDIAVATLIFLAAISLAFFMWNSVNEDIRGAEDFRELAKAASNSVEQLLRTPGVPDDWNYFTVEVIGIADDRVIDSSKASDFIELMNSSNYPSKSHMAGIGPYEFYLNVTDLNGTLVTVEGKEFIAGKEMDSESESVYMVRTAIYNDTIVRINFVAWR